MMWSGAEGMGWGWSGLGMVPMLLFWVLVIFGVAVLVRWLASGSSGSSGDKPPRAMDILKARYAKGEITREQFEQMKREIGESP
jgi:putative membrane protein